MNCGSGGKSDQLTASGFDVAATAAAHRNEAAVAAQSAKKLLEPPLRGRTKRRARMFVPRDQVHVVAMPQIAKPGSDAVAQNVQPMAQPTCDEMQKVTRRR